MTLLITIFAAIISTAVWYTNEKARALRCGTLCYMFWGASLMWFVDTVAEYLETGAEYFQPNIHDMLNDTLLGLSVLALALTVWIGILLVKDPKNVMKAEMRKK